jgi:hypothetical protein
MRFLGELCNWVCFEKEYTLGKCRPVDQETIDVLNYFHNNRDFPVGYKPKKNNPGLKTNLTYHRLKCKKLTRNSRRN